MKEKKDDSIKYSDSNAVNAYMNAVNAYMKECKHPLKKAAAQLR